MGTNRFLSMMFAIILGSIVFGWILDAVGFEAYAISTIGVLGIAILYLWAGRDISELGFWIIITYAGKNFEGWLYGLFFAILMIYILCSAGFIRAPRK